MSNDNAVHDQRETSKGTEVLKACNKVDVKKPDNDDEDESKWELCSAYDHDKKVCQPIRRTSFGNACYVNLCILLKLN